VCALSRHRGGETDPVLSRLSDSLAPVAYEIPQPVVVEAIVNAISLLVRFLVSGLWFPASGFWFGGRAAVQDEANVSLVGSHPLSAPE
jgi:hypothetical protein